MCFIVLSVEITRRSLLVISILISLSFVGFTLIKGRKNSLLYVHTWYQFMILYWLVLELIQSTCTNLSSIWLAQQFKYLSICFVGLGWFVFSMFYVDHPIIRKKYIVSLFFIPPAIFYIIMLTNEKHYLFFSNFNWPYIKFGIAFWLHIVETYGYIMIGNILIIYHSWKRETDRKLAFLITLTTIFPIAINCICIFRIVNPGFDLTPPTTPIAMILFVLVTFKYRFLNIVPMAVRDTFNNIDEAVVIIDDFTNRILDYNKTFSKTFSVYTDLKKNIRIELFVEHIKKYMLESQNVFDVNILNQRVEKHIAGELILDMSTKRSYELNIRPITSNTNKILGRIVTFLDISKYKDLLDEINQKNDELIKTNSALDENNKKLNNYLETVEKLAVANERNRVSQEIHDTLGHTLTIMIMLLKVGRLSCGNDPEEAREKFSEAIKLAQDGLGDLRRAITNTVHEYITYDNMLYKIEQLALETTNSGALVKFSALGVEYKDIYQLEESSVLMICDAIYKTCKEAITNSIRHGTATEINIILRFTQELIKLFIMDNGIGCKKIEKGFGLKGIEDRISRVGGSIAYGSDGERGFNIHIEIPVKG